MSLYRLIRPLAFALDAEGKPGRVRCTPCRALAFEEVLALPRTYGLAAARAIDAGFDGHITLELANVASLPITLYPGMKIGQLCLFRLSSPAEHPYGSEKYGSRYQGQRGPTPSRSFANFHRTQI